MACWMVLWLALCESFEVPDDVPVPPLLFVVVLRLSENAIASSISYFMFKFDVSCQKMINSAHGTMNRDEGTHMHKVPPKCEMCDLINEEVSGQKCHI